MNPKVFVFLSLLLETAAFQHPLTSPITIRQASELSLVRENNDGVDDSADSHLLASRRSFCARSIAATIAGASVFSATSPSYAEELKLEPYVDPDFPFKLQVPSSWEKTEQKLSGRRKAIFFSDPNSNDASTGAIETFGFIAYTPIRDDFTGLSSFGSVDEVAQSTILPKGELGGQDTDASKMLSTMSKNNAYYFDYVATPVVPIEPGTKSSGATTKTLKPQHFRTIFTLLSLKISAGLTLVTITLQTTEERYGDMKGIFDGVVDSYGKA
eukprot:CAMPEP_0201992596 /NCGR_PEP_ID=MMETSP0905-20130828/1114_1 /ASSEMBLY_ACC=CAM_ASM_000554 /TAXON_ID=420261 /ORGANISM="Thalassiosira antarctica, Strain CCMP982" /LENGTH=269 /DNA_ID=CAMNT_0048547289 /DNA_START=26 /DNA_END=835 /DNA_ORIENTATION=-